MKRKILTVIVLFTLAIFTGRFWQNSQTPLQEGLQLSFVGKSSVKNLPRCMAHKIESFELTQNKQTAIFTKEKITDVGESKNANLLRANWSFAKPDLGEVNSAVVQRLLSFLCGMQRVQIVKKPNLHNLGLMHSELSSKILVPTTNNTLEEWNFQFGAIDIKNKVALKLTKNNSAPQVFLVPKKIKELFSISFTKFQNKRLMRMPLASVDYIKVKMSGVEKYSLERNGSEWQLNLGKEKIKKTSKELQKFINRVATLNAINIASTDRKKDCSNFAKEVQLELEGVGYPTEILYFSRPDKKNGSRITACSNKRRSVLEIHPDMWDYLVVKPTKFRL